MKRSSPFRADTEAMGLQMTSMIDVIFLLLIFFVWTSSFRIPEELLPTPLMAMMGNVQAQDVQLPPEITDLGEVVILFYYRDNRPSWEINGTRYVELAGVMAVLKALAAQTTEIPVILDVVEDATPLEHVIHVYDAARLAGFRRVQFALEM